MAHTGTNFKHFEALFNLDYKAIYDEQGDLKEIKKSDGTSVFTSGDATKPANPDQVLIEIRKSPYYQSFFAGQRYNQAGNANIPGGVSTGNKPLVSPERRGNIPIIGQAEIDAIKEGRYVR